ncbi:PEP-CTERM sorting domain-containing protein [Fortiea sp. LEGE XX443]|uniref:PEP-CTERM sorting domain-containing protein n=1 Tax=Fortiea sp. LEGE XX443 TaxID=1828611 RepID=UPI001D13956E|nr:PEP-CTERM sorting domain-containing protein [Fortiea sp. LEGE XX443]
MISSQSATAATLTLDFTKLTGVTGGSPGITAVFRAEIPASNLGDITSIVIRDNSNSTGGSPGQVSGFDLDAIKLSTNLINSAADVNSISALDVFDFSSAGTIFTPGTQRPPTAPDLFGSTGGNINNAVATLGSFDANSTTDPSLIFGFVSLGDNGQVQFNLTSPVSTANTLYLYIGEVGDNGELATGEVTIQIPEPTGLAALSFMGIYFAVSRSKKNKSK